jgi:cytochrome P450
VKLDFTDPAFVADPFPSLENVRAEGRVVWNDHMRLWMVSGYQDAVDLLMDWRHFSNTILADAGFSPFATGDSMINTDPPRASELRRTQQDAFTRRSIDQVRPRIAEIVDASLERFVEKAASGEPVDFVDDFVRGVPTMVISEMLGVPDDYRLSVQAWTDDMIAGLAAGGAEDADARIRRAVEAADQMNDMFLREREQRRRRPSDDLLGVLADDRHGFSDGEFLAACQLLLTAGNETTSKAAANGVVLLARFPDERRRLVSDPALITRAVEEILRYEGVPQASPRLVLDDVVFAGTSMQAGQAVVALLVAANRDPAKFADPRRFDVGRHPNPHLAFAQGTHLCLGANLARLEIQLVLSRLLERFPEWEVTSVDYGHAFHVRGPHHVGFVGRPVGVTA